jgi:hypothetical protein
MSQESKSVGDSTLLVLDRVKESEIPEVFHLQKRPLDLDREVVVAVVTNYPSRKVVLLVPERLGNHVLNAD